MGDDTGHVPRAVAAKPCCYCGGSGHLPEWCTHRVRPPRPKAELRRITIYANDDRLSVLTLRGVGFSWRCTCGARGRRCQDRAEALRNKAAHEATHSCA